MKTHIESRSPWGNKQAYWFILPSMIILTVFVYIPLVNSFRYSFRNMDIFMQNVTSAGLGNYVQMFQDQRFWNAVKNTIFFTLALVPAQIIISLILVPLVSYSSIYSKAMRTIYYIPVVCSMTAVSIIFSLLLDPNMGLIPYHLKTLNISSAAFLKSPTLALPTLVVITVWKNFGYTLTILMVAAMGISHSLYEAADMDGTGFWKKFFYITIPGMWPSISFSVVTTTITSLQMFDQAYVMTKGGPLYHTETLVQYIYNRGFQTPPYSLGYASTLSVALMVIVAIVTVILRRFFSENRIESI